MIIITEHISQIGLQLTTSSVFTVRMSNSQPILTDSVFFFSFYFCGKYFRGLHLTGETSIALQNVNISRGQPNRCGSVSYMALTLSRPQSHRATTRAIQEHKHTCIKWTHFTAANFPGSRKAFTGVTNVTLMASNKDLILRKYILSGPYWMSIIIITPVFTLPAWIHISTLSLQNTLVCSVYHSCKKMSDCKYHFLGRTHLYCRSLDCTEKA